MVIYRYVAPFRGSATRIPTDDPAEVRAKYRSFRAHADPGWARLQTIDHYQPFWR